MLFFLNFYLHSGTFNIPSNQRNENQNSFEISCFISQNGQDHKNKWQIIMVNIRRKGKTHLLTVGVQILAVAMGTGNFSGSRTRSQNPVTPLFGLYLKHSLVF